MTAVVKASSGGPDEFSITWSTIKRTPATVARAVRLLLDASRPHFVAASSLQVLSGIGIAAQLLVGREVLDAVLSAESAGDGLRSVLPELALLVVVTAVIELAGAAATSLQRLLTEYGMKHVQERVLDAAAAVDLETFEDHEFFDRLQRTRSEGVIAPLRISTGLLSLTAGLVGSIGIAVALATVHPGLLPLVIVGYIPVWIATTKNSGALFGFSFGQTPNDRARSALGEVLSGRSEAAEVRAFGLFETLRARWERFVDARIDDAKTTVYGNMRRSAAAGLASSLLTAGVFAVLVWLLLDGRVDVAGAATAAFAIQQLGARLSSLSNGTGSLFESSLFLEDTMGFLEDAAAEATRASTGEAAPAGFDRLRVEGLEFAYPKSERQALNGVDLHIDRGEIIALVGENGSGKTTLAKVLSGLYRPTSGTVSWDGVDLSGCDPSSIREHVAVTFQDFVRYPLDAAENIGVGRPQAIDDRDRVREAAERAGANRYLEALPKGYDTLLAKEFDEGEDLSVGQWQRIALARAFFRDAPFIVLDEPTAALDPRAEYELFAAIRELFAGRTVLLISHRFSSVRHADRIYVLDEGRVLEHGSHRELMAESGRYAELFTMQADAYLDKGEDDRDDVDEGGGLPPGVELPPGMTMADLPPEIREKLASGAAKIQVRRG